MKRPFLTLGLSLAVLVAGLAATIQAGPPAQEIRPPRPIEGIPEDLPFLKPAPARPDVQMEPAAPSSIVWWSKLVFQSYQNGNWEIYRADGDGSDQARVTNNSASDIHPRLNRGSTRIVYASNYDGDYEIMRIKLDGSGRARSTQNDTDDVYPDWSPDGNRIAFQAYRDGQAEVYVMNANGEGQTRLTWEAGYDGQPVWSPDGTRIAFISNRTGGYRVWVMNADGSGKTQLSTQAYSADPTWSPDGSQMAYDADADGDGWQELWLMNADGSNQRRVYDPPESQTDAWARSWSPDGRYVAFTRISFVNYGGNWYWTEAYLDAWDTVNGGTVHLSSNGTDWHPGLQTVDNTVPTSRVHALPAQSPGPFTVRWSGSDPGPLYVQSFDVQVRHGTEGTWIDWLLGTTATWASYPGVGGQTYYFRCRARDPAYNVESWPPDYDAMTTVETYPPQTAVEQLPAYSHGEITVRWGGWDPGGSGIETYDVQYRDGANGSWVDWQMGTLGTWASFSGIPGHRYYFRSRGTDSAQNTEAWPSGGGDTHTALYTWSVSGIVRDNTDTPVAGAVVTTTPGAFDVIPSDVDGSYAAYVAESTTPYAAAWGRDGYGNLPATILDVGQDVSFDVFLPAADNVVLDWGFESGSLEPDWLVSGFVTPEVTSTQRHTGDYGVQLGRPFAFSPTVNVFSGVDDWTKPLLGAGRGGVIHALWRAGSSILHATRASDGTWYGPQEVPNTAGSGLQFAVGEGDLVHLVWGGSGRYLFYAMRSADGTWSEPESISGDLSDSFDPQLEVGESGIVHVVWHDRTPGNHEIFYTRRSSDGVWSDPENLSNSQVASKYPQLALDAGGAVHVVWHEYTGVFYAMRSSEGAWSDPQDISNGQDGDSPQLAVDVGGAVHVVWDPGRILYARRSNDGLWDSPELISDESGFFYDPQLVLGTDGTIHVAWTGNYGSSGPYDIYYAAWSDDKGWSVPRNVSNSGKSSSRPQLAADGVGTPHLVWYEWIASDAEVLYAARSGDGAWPAPHNISRSLGDSLDPQLVVGEGDSIHVVWRDDTPGEPSIYYSGPVGAEQTGDSGIAQAVMVPGTMDVPALSFLYQLAGTSPTHGTWFNVQIEHGLAATSLLSTATNTGEWTHRWFDLSQWVGQAITLSFNVHEVSGYPTAWAYLDEVSLGSAFPDPWMSKESRTPVSPPGEQVAFAITYGNRGGAAASGVQVSDQLPPELSFVAANPPPIATMPALVWDVGGLPAKSERSTIVVTATVSQTAPLLDYLTNTVTIETTSPELETANNTAQAAIFIGRLVYLPLIWRNGE